MSPLILGLLLIGAQDARPAPPPIVTVAPARRVYSAREAVHEAAERPAMGVPGVFAMAVTRTGREDGRVYLNSEADYRDQRNLTISIAPAAAEALARRFGAPPDVHFRGRLIAVRGTARRVRIDFLTNGNRPTGLYYYQTQIMVARPEQISPIEESGRD
jgi:hypothetical protein